MIVIKVKDGEPIERALRRYKRKYEKTGILKSIRERAYYKKPSVQKKEQMKKAVNRQNHFARENY